MSLIGMNVAEIRALASQLERRAEAVLDSSRKVDRLVTLTRQNWSGTDIDQFAARWHGGTRTQAQEIATQLRELASTARTNADEQERTSDELGASTLAASGSGGSGGGNDPFGWVGDGLDWLGDRVEDGLTWAHDTGNWVADRVSDAGNWVTDRVRDVANRNHVSEDDVLKDPGRFGLTQTDATRFYNARRTSEGLAHQRGSTLDPTKERPVMLWAYQPEADGGQGRAAICLGNPDTANNTTVIVPGTGSSVHDGWLADGHDDFAVDRERHLAGDVITVLQVSGQPRLGDGDQLLFAAADDPIGFRKVDLVDNLILQKNAPVAHKAGAAAPDQQRAGREARHGAVVTNRAYDADLFAKGEFRSHVPLS